MLHVREHLWAGQGGMERHAVCGQLPNGVHETTRYISNDRNNIGGNTSKAKECWPGPWRRATLPFLVGLEPV